MRRLTLALLVVTAVAPAWALYKVVGPDGKVTYTDRPPTADTAGKVAPMRGGSSNAGDAQLPLELRQPVARYPVTLYSAADCVPCDSARLLLQQRGVPHAEKRVSSDDDIRAYEQLTGGRLLPSLAVGNQLLRGLNTSEWASYLDAAGYPRESRLPATWKPPAASPLVEGKTAAAAPAASAPEREPARRPAPAPAPQAPTTTIRF